jgi:hypothetical protein
VVPPGTPVSSINETDRHDITEILLKVTLNTINQPTNQYISENKKFQIRKKFCQLFVVIMVICNGLFMFGCLMSFSVIFQ